MIWLFSQKDGLPYAKRIARETFFLEFSPHYINDEGKISQRARVKNSKVQEPTSFTVCLLPTWYIDISKASVATIPRLIQNLSDAPGQLRFLSKVEHLPREKFYGQFPGNFRFSVEVTVQRDSMSKCTADIFARSVIIYGRIDNIDKATFLLDVSLSFELKHTRRVVHKDIRTLTITNFHEYV